MHGLACCACTVFWLPKTRHLECKTFEAIAYNLEQLHHVPMSKIIYYRRLQDLSDLPVLLRLNLETLEHRRLSCDLTMYYKVFHSLTPWVPSDYLTLLLLHYSTV